MGVLDMVKEREVRTTANRGRNTVPVEDREPAKYWLNIGYQAEDRFVSLPIGIPLDTMSHAAVRGQNEDWIAFVTAQNDLLDALVKVGASLEPGEAKIIGEGQLVIQIRRVSEQKEVAPEDNKYKTIDFSTLLG